MTGPEIHVANAARQAGRRLLPRLRECPGVPWGNMQAHSIVVTRDRALRERLRAPHQQQDMVLEAPALLTFCSDFHRMRRWLALSDAEDGLDDGIRAIYRERETAGWARYVADPGLRARVEAAGVRNLAQIYTTVEYTRARHAEFSVNLLGCLRAQGFLPAG